MIIPKDLAIANYELMLTEDCGLRCTYCFDDYYSDRTKCDYNVEMEIEMIDDLIAFIMETFDRRAEIKFGFFGGEPIMNWPFLEKFITVAKKEFKFQHTFVINTNTYLLDSNKINFLVDNNVGISVSIDGTERANINRVTKNGKNSWESVVKVIPELLAKSRANPQLTVNALMVVNKNNYEYLSESYKFLIDLGFAVNILFDYSDDIDDKYLNSIKAQLEHLFIERRLPPFVDFYRKITNTKYQNESNNYCFTADHNVSIAPSGKLFYCHQMAPKMFDMPKSFNQYYGNIKEGYTNLDYYYKVKERNNFETWQKGKKCETCVAKNWCKGGCLAGHWHKCKTNNFDDINENICKLRITLHQLSRKIMETN